MPKGILFNLNFLFYEEKMVRMKNFSLVVSSLREPLKVLCLFWLVQLSCQVLSCQKLQMQCHAQDVTTVV